MDNMDDYTALQETKPPVITRHMRQLFTDKPMLVEGIVEGRVICYIDGVLMPSHLTMRPQDFNWFVQYNGYVPCRS
jgi:hypothetical protein